MECAFHLVFIRRENFFPRLVSSSVSRSDRQQAESGFANEARFADFDILRRSCRIRYALVLLILFSSVPLAQRLVSSSVCCETV